MHAYIGLFVVAFASLALEVSLSRLLSVLTWYHLGYFAISTAMLGMTAGAVSVYLDPEPWEGDRLEASLATSCIRAALAVPVSLALLCITPLALRLSFMTLVALLWTSALCSLPFFFSGQAITAALVRLPYPIGKLYGADLIGASSGCLLVLGGLHVMDAPSLILAIGGLTALAGLAFAWRLPDPALRRRALLVGWGLLMVAAVNRLPGMNRIGVRPYLVKGALEDTYLIDRWNSYSRVTVWPEGEWRPQLWGPSPKAPTESITQYRMAIDGDAGTVLRSGRTPADLEHLRYDVTNVAYALRPEGGACVIGVGSGRDMQSALLFGHERVLGVEVNPIFLDLIEGRFRDFVAIADRPGVRLVRDEARNHLTRESEHFSVVQMSLIDTWAATGAGAMSLSENGLYTREAWAVFLARLADDGVFTVSRWYSPGHVGETGRMVSLAMASLFDLGVEEPAKHIALVASGPVATLVLGRKPLSKADLAALERTAAQYEYKILAAPGTPPGHAALSKILGASSLPALVEAVKDEPFDYTPPTDENPFFFHQLKATRISEAMARDSGVLAGNLIANLLLLGLLASLAILCLATILVPLWQKGRAELQGADFAWSAAYFSLLGAGFMLVEVALIQRLSLLLGHPVYGLGVLLFAIILSTGVGSFLSERLPVGPGSPTRFMPLVAVALILAEGAVVDAITASYITADLTTRVTLAVLCIAPLGMTLGTFFPTGMRMVGERAAAWTPWLWALNGVFGVLFSTAAVVVSIHVSVSTNFYLSAACYLLLLIPVAKLNAAQGPSGTDEA